MHTSVAELRYDAAAGEASVAIRVFPDDLARAVPGWDAGDPEASLLRYVRERFTIRDRGGVPLVLDWKGWERLADVLVLRFSMRAPDGLAGAEVRHLLLQEQFDDQVNVVRATYGGRTATLLFTSGDGSKRLP